MTYALSSKPGLLEGLPNLSQVWSYVSTDGIDEVTAADYITDGDALGMRVGDVVHFSSGSGVSRQLSVVTVTADGAATLSAGEQIITASGAVTPGVSEILLSNAGATVAATIADLKDHRGFLVIKQVGGGTEGHTVTAAVGTFDGTNDVVTVNADNECVVIYIDAQGNGTVVENVGTVVIN